MGKQRNRIEAPAPTELAKPVLDGGSTMGNLTQAAREYAQAPRKELVAELLPVVGHDILASVIGRPAPDAFDAAPLPDKYVVKHFGDSMRQAEPSQVMRVAMLRAAADVFAARHGSEGTGFASEFKTFMTTSSPYVNDRAPVEFVLALNPARLSTAVEAYFAS